MKYKVSNSTIERLKGVDPRLVIIFITYLTMEKKDIGCTYGLRTDEEQADILKKGNSTVKRSKHQAVVESVTTPSGFRIKLPIGNAIDIVAYRDGKQVWERAYYKDIIEDMREIARFYGWQDILNWGWDFKSINDPYHISIKKDGDGGIK